jgi:Zn-dependent protease with chaperone function
LAHELGHLAAGDGVQTLALCRLAFFPSLLCGRPAGQGLINRTLRALTYTASGELALRIVTPIWAAHWRDQEYQADQFAAHLGQGPDLARFLEEHALLYDLPVPFVWMTDLSHPFTEERINRLPITDEPVELQVNGHDQFDPIDDDAYNEPMLPPTGDS